MLSKIETTILSIRSAKLFSNFPTSMFVSQDKLPQIEGVYGYQERWLAFVPALL